MNTIELKVNVQIDFSEQTKQFIAAILMPHYTCSPVAEHMPWTAEEQPTEKPVEQPAAPQPEAPAEEQPEIPEAPAEQPAAPGTSVTIEDVRKALQEKVNAHREKIKAKLTELGTPNVTKLDPAKYVEMYNFLIAL